jgi:nitroimidazol reductase NimA-like FMN-containing flavoprotein (pyridoxamine 5'-phosphate oxidase superfamily)
MDQNSEQTLARLIRATRVAALGTLHDGEPNLAMVAYASADDFSAFYIHVSKLGKHTRDMEKDPRVSLLITETDDGRPDPQTLARVSRSRATLQLGRFPSMEDHTERRKIRSGIRSCIQSRTRTLAEDFCPLEFRSQGCANASVKIGSKTRHRRP